MLHGLGAGDRGRQWRTLVEPHQLGLRQQVGDEVRVGGVLRVDVGQQKGHGASLERQVSRTKAGRGGVRWSLGRC